MHAFALGHSREGHAFEIPVENNPSPFKKSSAAARLSSYPSPADKRASTSAREALQQKHEAAEQRRVKMQRQRALSPKNKDRTQRAQIRRIQLLGSKKHAAAAGHLKRANAERNRQKLQEQRGKKAGQHVMRARAVAAAQKNKEQSDKGQKRENIQKQLEKAEQRRSEFLAQKKGVAERANQQVQSTLHQNSATLRQKRSALDQKQKDAAARRHVSEMHKARHTPSKLRPGSPTASQGKGAGGSFFGRVPVIRDITGPAKYPQPNFNVEPPPAPPRHTRNTAEETKMAEMGRSFLKSLLF